MEEFSIGLLVGVVLGYVLAAGVRHLVAIRKGDKELEFKQNALRPRPRSSQSSTALEEADRPHARVSKGKIHPRRGRKVGRNF